MDFPPRQCASSFRVICQEIPGQTQHPSVRASILLARPGTMGLLSVPKVKSALKGTRFESVEAVKEKAARVLKELTKDDFQHCFQQWKIRMERCRDREGCTLKLRKTANSDGPRNFDPWSSDENDTLADNPSPNNRITSTGGHFSFR
ncbi:FLJ37770-like protein [Trichonephila clavipes]|nr:FLJ37770-like protein [Trichonephila clavipes]